MKKLISLMLTLCLVLAAGTLALGEEAAAVPEGSWRVCGGTDTYDTLVFHQDGTVDIYRFIDTVSDDGLLVKSGPYEIQGKNILLPTGETYELELREATAENDLTIGASVGDTVVPGDELLFLEQEPKDDMHRFGFYVHGYYYPGTPAEEYLVNKEWTCNGETVRFNTEDLDNGRWKKDGKFYSLQCRIFPVTEDMTEEERDALMDQELLFTPYEQEDSGKAYWLSDTEIIAYPMEGGEPLTFSMIP